jgi:hypothetical protein
MNISSAAVYGCTNYLHDVPKMFLSGLVEKGRHILTLLSLQPPRLTRTLAVLPLFSHLNPVNGRPRYGRGVSIAERGFHRP